MLRKLALTSLLLPFHVGCSDDAPRAGDLRFADLAPDDRDQVIALPLGGGVVLPVFATFFASLAHDADPACPSREDGAGNRVSFVGGCTSHEGIRYDGRIDARNFGFFGAEVEASAPMSVALDGWTKGDMTIDGRFEQSVAAPQNGERYASLVDYRATEGGEDTAFLMNSACEGACKVDGFVELPRGSFAFEGRLSLTSGAPTGWIVLRGADELRIDFDAAVGGCAPITIDGKAAGKWCAAQPEPEPALEINGAGIGCSGTDDAYELDVIAWVKGTPTSVEVRVIEEATSIDETFTNLPEQPYDAEEGIRFYQLTVPESETELARCTDRAYSYAVSATDADGNHACAAFGDNPALFPGCKPF